MSNIHYINDRYGNQQVFNEIAQIAKKVWKMRDMLT